MGLRGALCNQIYGTVGLRADTVPHCGFVMLSANQLLTLGQGSLLAEWQLGWSLLGWLSVQNLAQWLHFQTPLVHSSHPLAG